MDIITGDMTLAEATAVNAQARPPTTKSYLVRYVISAGSEETPLLIDFVTDHFLHAKIK